MVLTKEEKIEVLKEVIEDSNRLCKRYSSCDICPLGDIMSYECLGEDLMKTFTTVIDWAEKHPRYTIGSKIMKAIADCYPAPVTQLFNKKENKVCLEFDLDIWNDYTEEEND